MGPPRPTEADLRTATDAWRRDRRQAGARLRALREAAGLTQIALAAASGVAHEVISRLELGRRAPQRATLRRLAGALGEAPAALVGAGPVPVPGPPPTADPPLWDGPLHGRLGVLEGDGERVRCHLCGGFYANLGVHASQRHGVGAAEYKERFGLKVGTGLHGPALAELRRTQARARVATPAFAAFQAAGERARMVRAPERRSPKGRPLRLEHRLDPARTARARAHLAAAQEALRRRRAEGTFREPGFGGQDQRALAAKGRARLAELRTDPGWRATLAAKVSAARGGRLRVTCVICGTTFPEPHSKRTRQTCSPACHRALRQRLVTERQTAEAADREQRRRAGLGLRARRRERGVTQAQVATAAGVSGELVSLVERGRHAASWATLERLAAVLGADVSEPATGSK